MACASALVRPNVSGTTEVVTATCASEIGRRHFTAMSDEPHSVAEAMARDEAVQLLAIGVAAWRIAGEDDHRVDKRALLSIGRPPRRSDRAAPCSGEPRRMKHDLAPGADAP